MVGGVGACVGGRGGAMKVCDRKATASRALATMNHGQPRSTTTTIISHDQPNQLQSGEWVPTITIEIIIRTTHGNGKVCCGSEIGRCRNCGGDDVGGCGDSCARYTCATAMRPQGCCNVNDGRPFPIAPDLTRTVAWMAI